MIALDLRAVEKQLLNFPVDCNGALLQEAYLYVIHEKP